MDQVRFIKPFFPADAPDDWFSTRFPRQTLRPDAQPNEIRAWTSIAVEGNETRMVIASLLGEPAVAELHDTNGRWDLLAGLQVASLAELSNVLERIRGIPGITATETSVHLKTLRG